MLRLILFLTLFATLSCSKEPPPTSSPPDNPSASPETPSSSSSDDPSASSSSVSPPSPEAAIPDAALRTLIEKTLKKNPGATITQSEMNTLKSLDGRELGIKSLSGLETATNLHSLNLSQNRISDLTPLAYLTQLQKLSLDSNEISDIAPLAYCRLIIIDCLETATNLQVLSLDSNKISDIWALAVLDSLQSLDINSNEISDLKPLAYLDKLRHLELDSNKISDITPLTNLGKLQTLYLNDNPLSEASLRLHIPALLHNGIGVLFSWPSLDEFLSSFYPLDRESPFNIDLVFLDDFTAAEREIWHHMANFWESAIQTELPDYEFSKALVIEECGYHSIRIPAGEQIDDLRIYITKFDEVDHLGRQVGGWGGAKVLRRSSSMPVIGCIGIEQEVSTQFHVWGTGLHEIGHVLGIGAHWNRSGMLRGLNADAHFAGPQAIAAFDQAGGTNYQGEKVPTELDGAHWPSSVLAGELMTPSSGYALSAITLGALSDLGYSVDLSAADPYVLPPPTAAKPVADAVPFCSLEGLPVPVYVDD